jgi:hypothetical protein
MRLYNQGIDLPGSVSNAGWPIIGNDGRLFPLDIFAVDVGEHWWRLRWSRDSTEKSQFPNAN